LAPARKPLALCVGGSVHKGLERLLLGDSEDVAVAVALADFSQFKSRLALDTTEAAAMAVPDPAALADQLARTALDLGMAPTDPSLMALHDQQASAAAEFDQWLWQEQAALVEGIIRAYARIPASFGKGLKFLLQEFEVLEVEREGEWLLHSNMVTEQIWFMSRPDALLRSRTDNSLYLLSFKTAAQWDIRKARDAEHDMQGLSEGVEVEKRLGEWWQYIHLDRSVQETEAYLRVANCSMATANYLAALPAPPRILGIRYEYLLKGSRYADKDLSSRFGLNVWAQRSHLIRAYQGDAGWCWSYDFLKDDGSASKLYYKTWRPRAVWESLSIREWIDMLDTATMTMSAYDSTVGMEPREVGYKCDAQAQGLTTSHPLDEVFPPPLTVYRSDDQLRDWIEQVEAQERHVAEAVAQVDAAADEGEKRHLLNVLFPQSRRACEYPSTCTFCAKGQDVCFGGEDMRRDPLASGRFKPREPHHAAELAAAEGGRNG
jgi:hypothetical protein